MKRTLDWKDEAAVLRWLADVRTAFADADAVTGDMMRPLRERDLGHVQHRKLYGEARSSLLDLLDYATPPEEPVH